MKAASVKMLAFFPQDVLLKRNTMNACGFLSPASVIYYCFDIRPLLMASPFFLSL
jgi:hypothetical protein